ncbi:RNA pyrophosphohydrolase [Pseudooceanicola marinus]|uniref:RNA pyrophosphohydrolase n=1 Tax=Pseudooceanicola marinus TaxID=396013 RepID=A0A1X6ZJN9_9RHOB|nr:RNA pyrophosphohydrolase [Pseudooceanicola marinus]PJE31510.1 RNA pyrophosphohydrolase [Pseudooceanicola marinus]SLN52897.1 RNA pyrophosphohydrolase [Pseudooceanicola marinus]
MTPEEKAALPYRPCAGVMLVNELGLVFTGQRNDMKAGEPPAWQMPQGGIDEGETPEEAALRELWEETGVTADKVTLEAMTDDWILYDLPEHLLGKIWKGKYRGQKQKWALMRFHGSDADIDIATDHPEFTQWKWMAPDELVENIVPFKRSVYEAVLAAFGDKI